MEDIKSCTIAIWGDSIGKGVVTGTSEKRFELVKDNSLALAQKALGFNLINKCVFGNIITKGKATLEKDLAKGVKADFGIIEFGGNDCDYDYVAICDNPNATYKNRTEFLVFCQCLLDMVLSLRKSGITPVLMTMPPLVADRWLDNICLGHDKNIILNFINSPCPILRLYQTHERYNQAILDCAKKEKVQLIDMRKEFLNYEDFGRSLMCKDGIHPNIEGYAFMAKVWEQQLVSLQKEAST